MLDLCVVQEMMTRFSSHLIDGADRTTGMYVQLYVTVSLCLSPMVA